MAWHGKGGLLDCVALSEIDETHPSTESAVLVQQEGWWHSLASARVAIYPELSAALQQEQQQDVSEMSDRDSTCTEPSNRIQLPPCGPCR